MLCIEASLQMSLGEFKVLLLYFCTYTDIHIAKHFHCGCILQAWKFVDNKTVTTLIRNTKHVNPANYIQRLSVT